MNARSQRWQKMEGILSVTPGGCIHRWLLGDPIDGMIDGKCRDCGAERSWKNYIGGESAFNATISELGAKVRPLNRYRTAWER